MPAFVRLPMPSLRPFVQQLWASVSVEPGERVEHVLPTGAMHIVFRLGDIAPLTLCAGGSEPQPLGATLVGGARSSFYVRRISGPTCSVGAQLRPGAAQALLRAPAFELAEAHTPLDAIWGHDAQRLRDRLDEASSLEAKVALLELALAARLPRARMLNPMVAEALTAFAANTPVRAAVKQSGVSHRVFIRHFRAAVGLAPKVYCRIRRFQCAVESLAVDGPVSRSAPGQQRQVGTAPSLAALALDLGYADQAHFSREFAALAGVTPAVYRRIAPQAENHVPIASRPPRHG